MRLILEKSEIIAILGKHFEAELDPEKVIIRTDPLEIEVSGLPLTDAPSKEENVTRLNPRRASAIPSKLRDDPDATTEPPPPGADGLSDDVPEVDVHPAAVLAASKDLERQLEKENPQLKRRSGKFSHTPPEDFKDEIP